MAADKSPGPVPRELRGFFERKSLRPAWSFRDVWGEEHKHAFTVAKVMEADLLETMRGAVVRAQVDGIPFKQFQAELTPVLEQRGWFGQAGVKSEKAKARRLETIYQTNLRMARAHGQWERIKRRQRVQPFLRYRLGPSEKHRPEHVALDGLVYPVDHPFWQTHFPPNGFGCFLPGSELTGPFVGASKAWYTGQAVEIETQSGLRVSVTVNHPVATPDGLQPAGALYEGSYCLTDRGEVEFVGGASAPNSSRRAVGDYQTPTRVQDVFDTLARQGTGPVCVDPATPLDFHGEAEFFRGQVQVVGTYRELVDARKGDGFSHLSFPGKDATLAFEAALGHAARLLMGTGAATRRIMRSLDLYPALSFVHASPSDDSALASAAYRYAPPLEPARERVAADAPSLSQLLGGFPRKVATDKIVRVRRFDFSGHVYDVETSSGLTLSNGILTSNCKCWVEQLTRSGAESAGGQSSDLDERLFPPKTYRDPRTGKKRTAPFAVDPGFEFPPGLQARRSGVLQALARRLRGR